MTEKDFNSTGAKPENLENKGIIPWRERLAKTNRGIKIAVAIIIILLFIIIVQQAGSPQSSNKVAYDSVSTEQSTLNQVRVSSDNKSKTSGDMGDNVARSPQTKGAAYSSVAKTDQATPPSTEAPPPDNEMPRKITQNLSAILQVDNVADATDKISEQTQAAGGYVVEARVNGTGSSANGNITIKIPADKFGSVKSSLSVWGKVLDQHLTTDDITNKYYDTQSRLTAWEAEQKRYLEILNQAKTIDEILRVESALANIRQQIEQLKGQLKLWNNQVDFSTIQIQLQTKPNLEVQIDDPWQPVSWSKTWTAATNAVLKTVSGLWNVINYLVIGIGYILPFLIVAIIAVLGYRIWRNKRKYKE